MKVLRQWFWSWCVELEIWKDENLKLSLILRSRMDLKPTSVDFSTFLIPPFQRIFQWNEISTQCGISCSLMWLKKHMMWSIERTNDIWLRFKLHVPPLHFLVWFMLLWALWVTDKLKEVPEQSEKVEVHCAIKRIYDYRTVRYAGSQLKGLQTDRQTDR